MSYPSRFVEFFGPSTWKTLHSIAWNYAEHEDAPTVEEKRDIIDFFRILENLLPCPSCRKHFGVYMLKHPIDASSRSALVRWLFDLHNDVNKRTHKETPVLTFEEHRTDYAGWNKEVSEKFSHMSRNEQMNKLSDPHFGRTKTEHQSAILDNRGVLVSLGIFGGIVVTSIVAHFAAKQNKKK